VFRRSRIGHHREKTASGDQNNFWRLTDSCKEKDRWNISAIPTLMHRLQVQQCVANTRHQLNTLSLTLYWQPLETRSLWIDLPHAAAAVHPAAEKESSSIFGRYHTFVSHKKNLKRKTQGKIRLYTLNIAYPAGVSNSTNISIKLSNYHRWSQTSAATCSLRRARLTFELAN